MTIQYSVHYADWLAVFPDEDDEEGWRQWNEFTDEAACSDKIDDRTARGKVFDTKEEAKAFAVTKLEKADKWLAYLEIKQCTIELIEKLK